MFRYYVSFSYQSPAGFGIVALDYTVSKRITTAEDVYAIRQDIARKGYDNVTVLGFSPYAQQKPQNNGSGNR
ncbi:hypothetical protein ACIBP4_01100 [Micromonospora maritima]|uniref:Uncharacterized protein n=1 Tax=Micromonospora maritima TaxID=986711 RepID=A0ABW7ZDG1_9ACTN